MGFKPGQSGNKAGAPRGCGKWQKLQARVSAADLGELIDRLLTDALAGDRAAARLVLERMWPPLRPVDAPLTFAMPEGTDLTAKAAAILNAAAAGKLPVNVAAELLSGLNAVVALKKGDEYDQRLKALEEARHGQY